jgi:hypothetical protein
LAQFSQNPAVQLQKCSLGHREVNPD